MNVISHSLGKRLHRLEIWHDGEYLGEYERSNESDIPRKTEEIGAALPLLLSIARKHGAFVVRWSGDRRAKLVYVDNLQVGEIPKSCWRRPSWQIDGTRKGRTSACESLEHQAAEARSPITVANSKRLGDHAEEFALALLQARGYRAKLLPRNYPTYDIRVESAEAELLISVKASRNKHHVRLGKRNSVERLSEGNFVLAFLPRGTEELRLEVGGFDLLILPAEIVRVESLLAHNAYYAERPDSSEYSVIVKAYDHRHRPIWAKWITYLNAWHQLPVPT